MSRDKILSMISLAKKAGKVVSGDFAVNDSIKKGMASLVIIANDASDRTKKDYENACDFYECALITYSDKETLGSAIGAGQRVSIAINDESFASAIMDRLN